MTANPPDVPDPDEMEMEELESPREDSFDEEPDEGDEVGQEFGEGDEGDQEFGVGDEGDQEFGEGDEEPVADVPAEEAAPSAPPVLQTKGCVFCGSEIAGPAVRCPHCAGFLPIAEGTVFKQYFFFLFACLAMAIGCVLPWERTYLTGNYTGADAIAGGFLLLFAGYGMIVSVWNIYHRKMIVWPVLLAAVDGAIMGWARVSQIVKRSGDELALLFDGKESHLEGFDKFRYAAKYHLTQFGPGLYLVLIFSTLVLLSVVLSIFQGAKQQANRKQEAREARMSSRRTRRTG